MSGRDFMKLEGLDQHIFGSEMDVDGDVVDVDGDVWMRTLWM